MIHYRPFLNCDPPSIAEIWRSQPGLRGRFQSVTPDLLERFVFSKLFFDHDGLWLAFDDERPVGFVHAGFGSDESGKGLSANVGAISMLLVAPHDEQSTIAAELLARGELFLGDRGAAVIYAGGTESVCPFYLGFYGGSQLSGVLASDTSTIDFYISAGYRETERRCILQRSLAGFRPPVSREQMQNRRRNRVMHSPDPSPLNWWDACMFATVERANFTLISLAEKSRIGSASFWTIAPLSEQWGGRAAGLLGFEITPNARRQGLGTFLLSDAFQQLNHAGFTLVEAHVASDSEVALHLLTKVGFVRVDEGVVLRKEL